MDNSDPIVVVVIDVLVGENNNKDAMRSRGVAASADAVKGLTPLANIVTSTYPLENE